jgi:hypothetical protein
MNGSGPLLNSLSTKLGEGHLRQLKLEFREEKLGYVRLIQRLLHHSLVLVRVKGSLRSPCGRP